MLVCLPKTAPEELKGLLLKAWKDSANKKLTRLSDWTGFKDLGIMQDKKREKLNRIYQLMDY